MRRTQPRYPDLMAGESFVARFRPDIEVKMLSETLFGILGILPFAFINAFFTQEDGDGLGFGLLVIAIPLGASILIARALGAPPGWVLTTERLFVEPDRAIYLRDIKRVSIWLMSLRVHTGTETHTLSDLRDVRMAAALIEEARP
ncbi:MAG: hypothetical protein AAFU59_01810 [Pseudomonadota bacterium]